MNYNYYLKFEMRKVGVILSWNSDKGFGFIKPKSGDKKLFVHIKEFKKKQRLPEMGQTVTYIESIDKQGRPCAIKAFLKGEKINKTSHSIFVYISISFICVVALAVLTGMANKLWLAWYVGLSLLTFLFYWKDKSAARKGRRRTAESTLQIMALLGGWPGALIGQQTLRHKSRKVSFRVVLWLSVLFNSGCFILLLSPQGKTIINMLEQYIR